MAKFGTIENVQVRSLWSDEARDFTPWLATEEGLALLDDILGLGIEEPRIEVNVGPFSADVLYRVAGEEDHLVVVENQFGKTDHDHLGKLITYASVLNAVAVVWIAESFTEEHRQALDWLNEHSGEGARYYGLRVYAIRIGNSLPAPQLEVISRPNVLTQRARDVTQPDASATNRAYLQFWTEIRDYMRGRETPFSLREPRLQFWYSFAVGRSNFQINLVVNQVQAKRVGCELYMRREKAKRAFDLLWIEKEAIDKALGYEDIEWQRLEGKAACRIIVYKNGVIADETQRQELIVWLAEAATRFYYVFSKRVRALDLGEDEGTPSSSLNAGMLG